MSWMKCGGFQMGLIALVLGSAHCGSSSDTANRPSERAPVDHAPVERPPASSSQNADDGRPMSARAKTLLAALRARSFVANEDGPDAAGSTPGSALPVGLVDSFRDAPGGVTPHFPSALGAPRAKLRLPDRSSDALELEDTSTGMTVRVRLADARPAAAEIADGYVVYTNAHASGATLLHHARPDGLEDFLSFDSRPGTPAVAYEVELVHGVSGLRLVGGSLEFLERGGAPRLRVAPPYLIGANGARTEATLSVGGCAVDKKPAAPWGRRVTAPGARTCTVHVSWVDHAVAYPALLDPRWTTTASMATARQDHTSTLLSNGKVLVAGGRTSASSTTGLATAELFDRTSGTWSSAGSMTGGRFSHSAVQLGTTASTTTSGKVLIAGGINGSTSLNTAQLYSASAGTWVAATNLNAARHQHTATVLATGQVLVAGGMSGTTVLNTAATYNPASGGGAWTATGNMASARRAHTATRLIVPGNATLNNKILVVGGNSSGTTSLTSVQLFDGTTWTSGVALSSSREGQTATALANGNVLVTGGRSGSTTLNTALLFNAASGSGSWASAGTMTSARQLHSATLLGSGILANGQVLVAGGSTNGTSSLSTAELWNGTTTWTAATALPAPVRAQTETLMTNGAVLIAGGIDGSTTQTAAQLYDPSFALTCTSNSQCASGVCADGVCCNTACSGNACQACNVAGLVGICSPKANGTACLDATVCNGAESCQAGTCTAGTPLVVNDNNPCTTDACNATTGVSHTAVTNGTSCANNTVCDGAETCQTGTCAAGTPPVVNDNNPCTTDACNATTGVSHTAVTNGTSCANNTVCDGAETCQAGTCAAGTPPVVNDNNPCTTDACNATTGVSHTAVTNGTSCANNTVCDGAETCQAGTCAAGTPPVVNDNNPCTTDACNATTGVSHTAVTNGTSCANNTVCDGAETCQAGTCATGTPLVVNDNNPCTTDACNATTGVSHTPVTAGTSCADNTVCNGAETCNATGGCQAGTPPVVNDGNPCTTDACNATTGVSHDPVAAGTSCADNTVCNGAETCNATGGCQAGTPPVVNDGNPCTTDACNATTGVSHDGVADGTPCEDGNACNGHETCQASLCHVGTPVTCEASGPCAEPGSCDPNTGFCSVLPAPDGTPCSDPASCSTTDECEAGACRRSYCSAPGIYAEIVDLGTFTPGYSSFANAINAGGDMAVTEGNATGPVNVWRVNADGSRERVGFAAYPNAVGDAASINAAGVIGGTLSSTAPMWSNPYGYTAARGGLGAAVTALGGSVAGINDLGQIAINEPLAAGAASRIVDGVKQPVGRLTGPRFTGMVTASGIGPQGEVIGATWTNEETRTLPGGSVFHTNYPITEAFFDSSATGTLNLNDDPAASGWQLLYVAKATNGSQITGIGVKNDRCHAFRLTRPVGGGPSSIVELPAFEDDADPRWPRPCWETNSAGDDAYFLRYDPNAINASGNVVGAWYRSNADRRPFFYSDQAGTIDLNSVVDPGSGYIIQNAFGITDQNEIVGYMSVPGSPLVHAYKLTLPERTTNPAPEAQIALRMDGVVDGGNGELVAIFGYDSSASQSVEIPLGEDTNAVSLNGRYQASPLIPPPTSFAATRTLGTTTAYPGRFLPRFKPGQTVSWAAAGDVVTASANGASLLTKVPIGDRGFGVRIGGELITIQPDLSDYVRTLPLSEAVAGKVVAATGSGAANLVSGALHGNAAVEDDGSTSYHIPIWVPDGIRGMQPSLSIDYRSNAPRGLFGKRWSLSGLSVISRCAEDLATDGRKFPVDFRFGDAFCIDGVRMRRVDGGPFTPVISSSTGAGEFRTPVDPFRKIETLETNTTTGIQSFRVFQPDGRIFYYGRTTASRLIGHPIQLSGANLADSIYAYYLDKIEDRFGNSILVHYVQDSSGGQAYTGGNQSTELIPTLIEWGGVGDAPGQRSVRFDYPPEPNDYDYAHEHWVGGLGILPGRRPNSITISGPNGAGNVVALKSYRFTYTPGLTITGENLLSQISECDANGVCKQPTTITWEAGSTDYTRTDQTSLGVDDVSLPSMPPELDQFGDIYRRIIAADVNGDGRDDIIYRAKVASDTGSGTCLGWAARLSLGTTFGSPIALPLGSDPDPTCVDGVRQHTGDGTLLHPRVDAWTFPNPADLVMADINLDGRLDMVSSYGKASFVYDTILWPDFYPWQYWYRAYLNTAGTWPQFSEAVLEAGTTGHDTVPRDLAIGDVNGDGTLEIVRPSVQLGAGGLWAGSIRATGSPMTTSIPNIPMAEDEGLEGTSVLDADGDGMMEIIRDTTAGFPYVTSPTMSGRFNIPPNNPPKSGDAATTRWLMDLNGDGLTDIAYVRASEPGTIVAVMSTGRGFWFERTTALPPEAQVGQAWRSALDNGGRVADVNRDGRDDLILVDNGAPEIGGTAQRTNAAVLLSNGDGTFSVQQRPQGETTIPVGRASNGLVPYWNDDGLHTQGYRTSVVLDINGDGLPDLLQLEGGSLSTRGVGYASIKVLTGAHLVSYIRAGAEPDLVVKITEGTGETISAVYAPMTDGSVYQPDPSACSADPAHLSCLVRGGLLTKSLTVAGGTVSKTQTFKYYGGASDRFGYGFLGFRSREIFGPAPSSHTVTTYGNWPSTSPFFRLTIPESSGYFYPYAQKPASVQTDVDTPQGPNPHHQAKVTTTYTVSEAGDLDAVAGFVAIAALPTNVSSESSDCSGLGTCSGAARRLSRSVQDRSYDSFGNITTDVVRNYSPVGNALFLIETTSKTMTYDPVDEDNWLVRVPRLGTIKSETPTESVTRTERFTPDATPNARTGYLTGETALTETEPDDSSTLYRSRASILDDRGRPKESIESSADGESRHTFFLYEDADGVYATTTARFQNVWHTSRVYHHPGFGLVVATIDENGVMKTSKYDTLGRLLSETGVTGAVTKSISYSPPSASGVDFVIKPENKDTRGVSIHLDPFGNETSRSAAVDGTHSVLVNTLLDVFGRPAAKLTTSKSGTASTLLNVEVFEYDDLNRVLSYCHQTSDGTTDQRCSRSAYDGRVVTKTNEAGRVTTSFHDALGRLSTQRAVLHDENSDVTFVRGPFGVLKQVSTWDGTGATNMAYDRLGRRVSVSRTGSGVRGTDYNAFGEVVGAYKMTESGRQEEVTVAHDGLGRVTNVYSAAPSQSAAPSTDRVFRWDLGLNGVAAPNGIGKLGDVVDNVQRVVVHDDYYSTGLISRKTWKVWNGALEDDLGSGMNEVWTANFAYDDQSRLQTLAYPERNCDGPCSDATLALRIQYEYDAYTGTASTLRDLGAPSNTPFWRVTERSRLGDVAHAVMQYQGPEIDQVTNYFVEDGRLKDSTLSGPNAQSIRLAYAYQSDGVPLTLEVSGGGDAWMSRFGNDNLGRLTSWQPDVSGPGSPTVIYDYDSDGNLLSRSWSGETVSFATSGLSRTVTTTRGSDTRTDVYLTDDFGRVVSTPLSESSASVPTITFNEDDSVGSVRTQDRWDAIRRDGSGSRVLTRFGEIDAEGRFGSLLTLDSLFEYRRDLDGSGQVSAIEERCHVFADGKLIADITRNESSLRSATFLLEDNVHSVLGQVSSDGVATARTRRDPYGNAFESATAPYLLDDAGTADPNGAGHQRFGGHIRDGDWGMVDMLARTYSPRLGRFMSPDPVIGDALDRRDYNAFAYVQNSPTLGYDPFGAEVDGASEAGAVLSVAGSMGDGAAGGGWEYLGTLSTAKSIMDVEICFNGCGAPAFNERPTLTLDSIPNSTNTTLTPGGAERPTSGPLRADSGSTPVAGSEIPATVRYGNFDGLPKSLGAYGAQTGEGILGYGFAGPGTIGLPALIVAGAYSSAMLPLVGMELAPVVGTGLAGAQAAASAAIPLSQETLAAFAIKAMAIRAAGGAVQGFINARVQGKDASGTATMSMGYALYSAANPLSGEANVWFRNFGDGVAKNYMVSILDDKPASAKSMLVSGVGSASIGGFFPSTNLAFDTLVSSATKGVYGGWWSRSAQTAPLPSF